MRNLLFRTILAIVLLLGVTSVFAAVTLIGGGSATTYDGFGSYYGYMRCASIYTATEIGGYGTIDKIGLLPTITKAAANVPIVVYMRSTTNTAEVAELWSTKISGLTPVYTGTVASLTLQTWANVTLSAPFDYTTGNLEILIEQNYGGGGNSPYQQFYATVTTGTSSAWYERADNTPPATVGAITTTRQNIRLNFTSFTASLATPTQAEYTNPMHTATGLGYTPTFTWNPGNGNAPTGYRVYLGTDGSGTALPTTYLTASGFDNGTSTTYTPPTNLVAGTAYWFAVVPYNVSGSAPYTPIWKFTVASALTANVTTFLPATAATNVSNIGKLRWAVVTGATSYDVYYDTFTPPTTLRATVIADASYGYYYPGELAYSTPYYWKVIPKNILGPSTGTPTYPTFTTWADQTVAIGTASVNQNFDAATTLPVGWTTYKTDVATTATGLWAPSTSYAHSTTRSAYFGSGGFAAGTEGVLVGPRLTLPAEACRATYWIYLSTGSPTLLNERIDVYITNNADLSGATLLRSVQRYNATAGWVQYIDALPVGAGAGKYIFFKGVAQYGASQYLDDVVIEKIPQTPDAATTPSPAHLATLVGPTPVFTWAAPTTGAPPTGYKISIGTTIAANEILPTYNNGTSLTYTYGSPLAAGLLHYWKVTPYNLVGDCGAPAVWSFTTAAAVTGVAGTPNPADAATMVMNNAVLSWSAVTNATSYDVYLGTPGLPPTATANVLTPTYTPPAVMNYNGVYTWKVVPKNGFGETSGTPLVWTFTVGPDPLVTTFPLNESFDAARAGFPPYGWTNKSISVFGPNDVISTGTVNLLGWDRQTAGTSPTCTPHSGAGLARYNAYSISGGNKALLSSPPMNIPGDDYRVTFWMYRDLSSSYNTAKFADEGVTVWYGTSAIDTTLCTQLLAVPRDGIFAPTVAANGWYQYIVPFGVGSTGNGKYVVFKGKSQFGNNIFLDDVSIHKIPTAPLPAIIGSPANNAAGIALTATLNWSLDPASPAADGYKLYFGEAEPLSETPVYDGTLLTWTPSPALEQDKHYFWKVVPYNGLGDAVGSVVWNFYTVGRPLATTPVSPLDTATGVARNAALTWAAAPTATSYDVYFGATLPVDPNTNVTVLTWAPPLMDASSPYVWKIVPKNTYGAALSCPTWSFTTGTSVIYAASTATSTADDDIGQFVFDTFTNPVTAPTVFTSNAESVNMYSDFTAMTVNVLQDHIYPISIMQINLGSFYGCDYGIYIDFNQNGTFDLPAEQVFAGVSTAAGTAVTGNATIPADATPGATRLRVVCNESTVTSPTGTYTWGETEDYTCFVTAWVSPTPPNPATNPNPADLATDVSLLPTLSWTSGGGGPTGYKIGIGTVSGDWELKDIYMTNTYVPEVGDLVYGQRYYWQIVPYNTNGPATDLYTCPIWQFDTMEDPTIDEFPYDEGFEGTATVFPPNGWTADQWSRTTETHTGTYAARAVYTPAGTKILTSPPIELPGPMILSWWEKNDDMTAGKIVDHDYTYTEITDDGGLSWNLLHTLSAVSYDTAYNQVTVSLADYSGTVQLRWRYVTDGTYNAYGSGLDDIHIEAVPTAPVLAVDKEKLLLPVTPLGGASSDALTISNIGPGNLTGTISYDPPGVLDGPYTFTQTPEDNMVFDVTYTPTAQGLFTGTVTITSNGGTIIVPVESNAGRTAVDWEVVPPYWYVYDVDADAATWGWYTGAAHTGTYSIGDYYSTAGNDDWIISPLFEVQVGDVLSFYCKSNDPLYPEALAVLASTTGNTPADFVDAAIIDLPAIEHDTYQGYQVSLDALAGSSVYFAFHDYSVDMWYLFVDDMGLPGLVPMTVDPPANPVASLDPDGVMLNWDVVAGATSYNVYWSANPFALPEAWTLLANVLTNSYLDITDNPLRFYMVTADNGGKGRSNLHSLKAQTPISAPRSLKNVKK